MSITDKINLTTISTSDIHYLLNKRMDNLRKPWTAVIPLPIIKIHSAMSPASYFDPTNGAPMVHAVAPNLCDYVNGAKSPPVTQIYFDPMR